MNALYGIDYEWYCSDSDGNIAAMITAGEAPIPEVVLNNIELNDRLRSFVWALPISGGYTLLARDVFIKTSSGRMLTFVKVGDAPVEDNEINQSQLKDFIGLAKRGFFAYDYLPQEFRSLVQRLELKGVQFHEAPCLDVAPKLQCQ
jgi:hypothetical protein